MQVVTFINDWCAVGSQTSRDVGRVADQVIAGHGVDSSCRLLLIQVDLFGVWVAGQITLPALLVSLVATTTVENVDRLSPELFVVADGGTPFGFIKHTRRQEAPCPAKDL